MTRLEDLDAKSQARIRALADAAPPLTEQQRERLQLLFRGGVPDVSDARYPQSVVEITGLTAPTF